MNLPLLLGDIRATDLVVVPLIAALACALLPLRGLARAIAVLSGVLGIALSLALAAGAAPAGGLRGEEQIAWAPALGISYHVGADGFGVALLALGSLLFSVGAVSSGSARGRGYFALWCALQAAVSGVFVAQDLLLFFVFWEAMLLPLALLLWQWGGEDRRSATLRFVLYTMAGSALLLAGILALGIGAATFDIVTLRAHRLGAATQTGLAVLFLAAFVVKLPLFPFHAWLARAYVAAPLPVALVLSGIVAKTAAYGIIRLCLGLFPLGMETLAPGLVALAAIGTLYAALLATRQDDTRRLIAYSSLSHLNLIGLGIFAGSAAGAQGALVASVSHGLIVAVLFLLAGMLATRTGGWDLGRSGGLAGSAPVLAACFTLAVVATIGVPGTSGFAGEFLVLAATYARYPAAAALATLVVIVAAVYGLGLLRRAFTGVPGGAVPDLGPRERALVLPLLALILVLGIAPRVVSDLVPGGNAPVHAADLR
ncbi:MAG TPA: NADH-quinone oxidoreductase subunit M [Candidatus Saccharimonadales bacterium]|nr:NADH-quinone oxidoreductase subunit M [Candidatus Saccharimonadales bacterium]